jgi:hypothetical protein
MCVTKHSSHVSDLVHTQITRAAGDVRTRSPLDDGLDLPKAGQLCSVPPPDSSTGNNTTTVYGFNQRGPSLNGNSVPMQLTMPFGTI